MNLYCVICGWNRELGIQEAGVIETIKRTECYECGSRFLKIIGVPRPLWSMEYPYLSKEDEVRWFVIGELNRREELTVWDCRWEKCTDWIDLDGIAMRVRGADFVYKHKGRYRSVEVKFTKLTPRTPVPSKGAIYWGMYRPSFKMNKGEYKNIWRGGGYMVIVSEHQRTPPEKQEMGPAQSKEMILDQIKRLRERMGRNERPYECIIVDKTGIEGIKPLKKAESIFQEKSDFSFSFDKAKRNSVKSFSAYLKDLPSLIVDEILKLDGI